MDHTHRQTEDDMQLATTLLIGELGNPCAMCLTLSRHGTHCAPSLPTQAPDVSTHTDIRLPRPAASTPLNMFTARKHACTHTHTLARTHSRKSNCANAERERARKRGETQRDRKERERERKEDGRREENRTKGGRTRERQKDRNREEGEDLAERLQGVCLH